MSVDVTNEKRFEDDIAAYFSQMLKMNLKYQ